MNSELDTIYSNKQARIAAFEFDDKVACVFPDMIKRSVPGYDTMLATLAKLATTHSQAESNYYDLGCSLGAASLVLSQHINQPDGQIIAVDNSPAMLSRAREQVSAYHCSTPVNFLLQDINQVEIHDAAIVVLNFTLQFLDVPSRIALIDKIYQGLKSGGLLFISEKLQFSNLGFGKLVNDLHLDYKRANGYSELEISQKRISLENVLIPETYEQHAKRFEHAGFSQYGLWYQHFNFCSMIAIKE